MQHLSSSGNVIVSDSELICLIWQCGCIWAHLADLAGTGSIPGGGSCQESRARGARTGAGDVMELRQAHASTAADGDPMQIKPRHRSATTSTHANNCRVRVKIHVITILKHCHYPGLEWMWLREDINWKKTFSFGHCPNYLPPPPMAPIRATWSSFFGSRNSRFESQFKT